MTDEKKENKPLPIFKDKPPAPNQKSPLEFLTDHVKRLGQKVNEQRRLGQSFFIFVKDLERKVDAAMGLLIERGLIKKEDYDKAVDVARGVVEKGPDDIIEKSDIVYVSYDAIVQETEEKLHEDKFPIRIGSGRIAFEGAIMGQKPNTEVKYAVCFPPSETGNRFAGKTVNFVIQIHEVKRVENQDGRDKGTDGMHQLETTS